MSRFGVHRRIKVESDPEVKKEVAIQEKVQESGRAEEAAESKEEMHPVKVESFENEAVLDGAEEAAESKEMHPVKVESFENEAVLDGEESEDSDDENSVHTSDNSYGDLYESDTELPEDELKITKPSDEMSTDYETEEEGVEGDSEEEAISDEESEESDEEVRPLPSETTETRELSQEEKMQRMFKRLNHIPKKLLHMKAHVEKMKDDIGELDKARTKCLDIRKALVEDERALKGLLDVALVHSSLCASEDCEDAEVIEQATKVLADLNADEEVTPKKKPKTE